MAEDLEKYGLDLHCTMILEEYREKMPVFEKMREVASNVLKKAIDDNGILVTALDSRIKTEKSLAGKLELKGAKYRFLDDLTDILGVRVITFFSDEVDKIAALAANIFEIDWKNSVDKRKMHELDNFGYMSLHYICSIPKSLYFDPEYPEINEIRFELQMRTALQHVWATMYHDTGYKSGVEIPREYLRNLNRLAGMLELADDEFSRIRTSITDYRRKVEALVADGHLDEVPLDGDTFRSYLNLRPFDALNKRIASVNHAEIHEATMIPYLKVLLGIGFKTLGDVDNMIKQYSEDAYQLALYQIGGTDLDIISATLAIQNLLVVRMVEHGGGERGLRYIFDTISGPSEYNADRAQRLLEQCSHLSFMNK